MMLGLAECSPKRLHAGLNAPWTIATSTTIQWELQDPTIEVLYHIRQYFAGIFPYIGQKYMVGTSNKSIPVAWPLNKHPQTIVNLVTNFAKYPRVN